MNRASKRNKNHDIYWITGQSGAGKTTLAHALRKKIGGVVLDGDEMRESISFGAGFSKKHRINHNLRVAMLASVLSRQLPVIVSVIAPFESTRKKIDDMIKPVWIYVASDFPRDPNKPYEIPKRPHITLTSDASTLRERLEIVINYIKRD